MVVPRVTSAYAKRPEKGGGVRDKAFEVCRQPYRKFIEDAIKDGDQGAAGQLFGAGMKALYPTKDAQGNWVNEAGDAGGQNLSAADYERLKKAVETGNLQKSDLDTQCAGIAKKETRGPLPKREKAHVDAYRRVGDLMKQARSEQEKMGFPVGQFKGRGNYPPAVFQQEEGGTDEYGNTIWLPVPGSKEAGKSAGPCVDNQCDAGLHCNQGFCVVPEYKITLKNGQVVMGDLAKEGQSPQTMVLIANGVRVPIDRSNISGIESMRSCPPDSYGVIIIHAGGRSEPIVPPSGNRTKLAWRMRANGSTYATCIGGAKDHLYGRWIPIYPAEISNWIGLQSNWKKSTTEFERLKKLGLPVVISPITHEQFVLLKSGNEYVRIYKDDASPSPLLTRAAVDKVFESTHGKSVGEWFEDYAAETEHLGTMPVSTYPTFQQARAVFEQPGVEQYLAPKQEEIELITFE